MKISAIIPFYNSEKYLDRLLTSIQKQTYRDYEVILVNDGSTDSSLDVIKKFDNKKMKCITIKNSGPGIARKEGFKIATGDLLFFIDSDDFIPNELAFERIDKIYRESKFDILFFSCVLKYKGKEVKDAPIKHNKKNLKDGLYSTEYLKEHSIWVGLWSKIFVKNKMSINNFCNSKCYEDAYTVYTYLNNCNNFYFTNEVFYYSDREVSNSLSKKIDTNKIFQAVENLKEIFNITDYKLIFSKLIYNFYIYTRKLVENSQTNTKNEEEKLKQIDKLLELKRFYNEKKLFKLFSSPNEFMKYCYFKLKGY